MDTALGFLSPLFWGLVTLSALVFVHEGGHFLAARACGVRVTEFFLGLPCRFNVHHVSRRIGTKFGVTPLLLGGYAMICGMEPVDEERAPQVLSLVHAHGSASTREIACALDIDEEQALESCVQLMGWGSLAPVYDEAAGEKPGGAYYPSTYAAMPRDASGNTIYDGRRFDRAHATAEGEAWVPPMGERAFFEQERSRTYIGKGFWKRALMLIAGIAVNIVSGFLLLMSVYSVIDVTVVQDVNVLGEVEAGSVAAEAGLEAGDSVLSIGDNPCSTWTDIYNAVDAVAGTGAVELVYARDGVERATTVSLDEGERLGVTAFTETVHLDPVQSARVSFSYVAATAEGILQLLQPQHTMEVLDNSTSIVGISVMSAQAASAGPATFLSFAALISFSLGFMNLLPIPPLDGGKLLIEIIQAVSRKNVPIKVQTWISYVGVGLFLLLFVYMLRSDILRFIL